MPDADESAKRTRPSSPVPDDYLKSKKTGLLRAIAREITEGLVSETILESLEIVEKLDRALQGNSLAAPQSMSAGYCAVALDCTVKLLVVDNGRPGLKYSKAFDRIWVERLGELERLGESSLVTAVVKEWRDELKSSFYDRGVCEKLCQMNTRNEALRRVRVYLEEEEKNMGISFLECEVEFVEENAEVELEGLVFCNSVKEPSFEVLDDAMDEEFHEEGRVRVDNVGVLASVCNLLTAYEVNEVEEEVRATSLRLQSVVAKSSPKSILGAEIIMSLSKESKDTLEKQREKQVDEANQTVGKRTNQLAETSDVETGNWSCENRGNVPQPGLMEQKSTVISSEKGQESACIYEWDEKIDGSPKVPANHEKKINPKRKVVNSPLEKNGAQNASGRRRPRRWSLHEEDALSNAVKRYGKSWKFILDKHGDDFDERTEIDLKDKWRNMTKYKLV